MNKKGFFQGHSRAFTLQSSGAPSPRDIYLQSETITYLPTITDSLAETGSPQHNTIITRSKTGSAQPLPVDIQPETMSPQYNFRSTSEAGSTHSQPFSIDLPPETVAPQYPTVMTGPSQPYSPSLLYFPPNYSYGCLEKKWSL